MSMYKFASLGKAISLFYISSREALDPVSIRRKLRFKKCITKSDFKQTKFSSSEYRTHLRSQQFLLLKLFAVDRSNSTVLCAFLGTYATYGQFDILF